MRRKTKMMCFLFVLLTVALTGRTPAAAPRLDEVLYWNNVVVRANFTAATPGPLYGRQSAIVHVAMFEAYNGIERRFTPIRNVGIAPLPGASRRAAIVGAAYTALVGLFPSQAGAFLLDRDASLNAIATEAASENSESIARGLAFGEQVALEILAWRAADGLSFAPSSYSGSLDVGKWRPTPRLNATPPPAELPGLNASFPTLATTTPFVIEHPWSFRPAGPPALSSTEYADNVAEVQSVGELTSVTRTADQTHAARFWAGTAGAFWNRAAAAASKARHLTLSENARLFALLNVAIADAAISCWDSKFHFEFWRPITAIRLADTDGNAATTAQPTWTPLIVTPPYPDYYSGHQSGDAASATILTAYFGDEMNVEGFSEGFGNAVRKYANFWAAADEAYMARIWSGIHFRFAMEDSRTASVQIAEYILQNAAVRVGGGGSRP